MTPRHFVDLHGLSLDEAEIKVRAMIEAAQEETLADFEVVMVDIGADSADAVARRRAELAEVREQLIEKMRAMVGRGGKGLQ